MVDLAELEETITKSVNKAVNDINKIDSKEPSQREKFINTISKHIEEIKENLELYDYTCLDYTKRPEFPQYKKKYAELKKQCEELKSTFEKKRNYNSISPNSSRYEYSDPQSVGGLIEIGNKTQEAGLDALDRIAAKVLDANDIADAIMTEEERQLESLKKTLGNIQETKQDIKTARKIISYFAKELIRDKFWRFGLVVIIIALIAIIIKYIDVKVSGAVPDTIPYDYFNGYN